MNQRPLRVAHVISCLSVGGVQSLLRFALPLLNPSEIETHICCTYKRGEWAPFFEERGIFVHLLPMRSRQHPFDLWRMARWLRKNRIDIVHTHMYAGNVSGALAGRLAGISAIVSHIHSNHEWRWKSRGRMDRWMDRFRSKNIAVSGAVRESFYQHTGLKPSDKCIVLPNIRPPLERCHALRETTRLEYGLRPENFVLGSVARFVPVKHLDLMLQAGAKVMKKHPQVQILLVGNGKEREKLQSLVAELGISDRVVFAGWQDHLARFYEAMDLFVLSSRAEGCGIVILEAMGFDLPIVATAVGGVPEIIQDGENGLLAEPGNPDALASAIERVIENPDLTRRFAQANQPRIPEYAPERYVQKLTALYQELYAARRKP